MSIRHPYCTEWVWSEDSDVHAAASRYWFSDDYVEIDSFFLDRRGRMQKVIGMGTVILPTKRTPNESGARSHSTLRLNKVLHAPSILCNVIGYSDHMCDNWEILSLNRDNPKSAGAITNISDGQPVAYFKPLTETNRLFQVRLSGPPIGPEVGEFPFCNTAAVPYTASWPDSERNFFGASVTAPPSQVVRQPQVAHPPVDTLSGTASPPLFVFKSSTAPQSPIASPSPPASPRPTAVESPQLESVFPSPATTQSTQSQNASQTKSTPPPQAADTRPLTEAETDLLKAHHGKELQILCDRGTLIFKREFRIEGRAIVRALLACEGPRENQLPRFEILTPFESAWLQRHHGSKFKGFKRVGMEIFKHEFKEEGRCLLRTIMSYHRSRRTLDSLGMPLTEKETTWLKSRWNTELELLQSYRLSIDNENDREVGRRIVRALMPKDPEGDNDLETDIVTDLGEMLQIGCKSLEMPPPQLQRYKWHASKFFLEEPIERRLYFSCASVQLFDLSGPMVWSGRGDGKIRLPPGHRVMVLDGKSRIS